VTLTFEKNHMSVCSLLTYFNHQNLLIKIQWNRS